MCVEARILTCGHEYHTGSLIISFCYIIACEGFSRAPCLAFPIQCSVNGAENRTINYST